MEEAITHTLSYGQRTITFCHIYTCFSVVAVNSVSLLHHNTLNSLVSPVEPHGYVPFDLSSLVLGKVTLDQLPSQVDQLIHHMAQLMEQIHLVFLLKQSKTFVKGKVGRLRFCI